MTRVRSILGIVSGVMMILSAFAHGIPGWQMMGARLAATNAPADLQTGFKIGWIWGAPPMFIFGVICVTTFLARLRGKPVSLLVPALIAITYIGFGVWALLESGDPFFLIFIVPGVLLAVATIP